MNPDTPEPINAIAEFFADDLPALLRLIQESDVSELELQEGDIRIRVHRTGRVVDASTDPEDTASPIQAMRPALSVPITSPLVGTFYRAGTPGMAPLVAEGSRVERDTVVGIVEALQVLTEVEAGCEGIVTDVLATDGQAVEYGQTLFEVSPGA